MSAASEVSAVTTTFRVAWIRAGRRGHVWSSTESCTDAARRLGDRRAA